MKFKNTIKASFPGLINWGPLRASGHEAPKWRFIRGYSATSNKSTLKEKLENFKCNNKKSSGPFRMPIDRIFSVKGFGTVVTGTVTSGSAKIGNEVKIEPISKLAKIRGINTHNSSSENVVVGQRAAINLQNIDKVDIKRGYQLVNKHFFKPVSSIIAKIKTLDDLQKPIKRNQRIRFHLGTAEVIGKIYIFSKTL